MSAQVRRQLNNMNKLLKRLPGLLFPGIDGEPEDGTDPADTDAPDSGDDDLDDLPESDDSADPPATARSRRDDSGERLARLEAEVERRGRIAAEQAARQPATVDPELAREEERLRNPEISEIERWQIQANRTLRATQQQAQQALQQAQDMADRTRFEAKISSDPRRAKYTDRVEEAIRQERAAGRNAEREAVYFYMLGKDIAEGKLKPKAKASTTPNVKRGRPAGVRSDVQGRGQPSSDRDKLRARLENTNI
jgi:hypothetical protein